MAGHYAEIENELHPPSSNFQKTPKTVFGTHLLLLWIVQNLSFGKLLHIVTAITQSQPIVDISV
jgi:hypothetical protein